MKNLPSIVVRRLLRLVFFASVLILSAAPAARAGITFDLRLIRDSQGTSYNFYTEISTNDTPPAAPLGNYLIASPQQPNNGTWRQLELTAGGFNFVGGSSYLYSDYASAMQQITNGNWTITFTNATTTNHYTFTVSAPNVTSNMLPALVVTTPTENEVFTTAQPTFTWNWPNTWGANADAFVFDNGFVFFQYASLPAGQNNWAVPTLPSDTLHFQLRYETNSPTPFFPATTPLNTISAQPISGWVSAGGLLSSADVNFSVNLPAAAGGHTNLVYYSFEDDNIFAHDYSPNGNNVSSISSFGGGSAYTTNSQTIGSHAAYFFNNGGSGASWLTPPTNLLATLAGTFSVSLRVNTTQATGNNTDGGLFGNAGLVSAFNGPGANWVVPMAITGNKLAFATGGSPQSTLHSASDINTGSYVHLVVTRNQSTGEKKIYVNGVLDATETGSTNLLDTPSEFTIGYNNGTGLNGRLDDIQIYSGVLSGSEVLQLYNNPGTTIPDSNGSDFNQALNTTNLTWTTGGDLPWFTQTTNTLDGLAAQSGAIDDDESSYLQTTVPANGQISFNWKVSSEEDFDYLTFYINGNQEDSISGDVDWFQESYQVSAGDVLRWEYSKDQSNSENLDAGFLDEVSFITSTAPVITFQPIDQTNYSGYPLTLIADATSNPAASWQWYKVGSGLIPGATSRFYSPTNFGTASVAGSYYATANNGTGLATTRTAVVTYVSAPLPPDWSKAFQAQLNGNFNEPRTNYGIASLVDASGNIYAANSFSGTNYFTTNTFVAGPGRFAAGLFKHGADGTGIWGRAITNNGSGNSYPQCLAHAPGDGVYMSGVFFGTNGIGTNILQETAGASLYLARFDSAGNVLWVRTFGGTNSQFQSYHQLVSDPAGNVTISALGNNFVNFGTTNLVVEGQKGVLAQYDANGNIRWISKPSGWVQYMTYDTGRIYTTMNGNDNQTNYIGGVTNTSDRKFTLAALNATNGQALWLRSVGSALGVGNPIGFSDDIPAISVSSSNVFLTGIAWGSSAVFGGITVSWSATNSQYFARYDTNGNAQLATSFGGTNVWPWAAVADASGNVYVTGDFNSYATFGNKVISSPRLGGIQDGFYGQMFLAKFDRNGNSLWIRQAQSVTPNSFVNVRDLSLATDGVWVCGFVNDYANFGTNIANRVYGPVTVVGSPFGYLYYYVGGFLAKVTDGSPAGLPVVLLAPQQTGGNFQVQFQSQNGFTHAVQYRTNLAVGSWQTYSNVTGDGALKTIPVPMSVFNPSKQGFVRVSTQ